MKISLKWPMSISAVLTGHSKEGRSSIESGGMNKIIFSIKKQQKTRKVWRQKKVSSNCKMMSVTSSGLTSRRQLFSENASNHIKCIYQVLKLTTVRASWTIGAFMKKESHLRRWSMSANMGKSNMCCWILITMGKKFIWYWEMWKMYCQAVFQWCPKLQEQSTILTKLFQNKSPSLLIQWTEDSWPPQLLLVLPQTLKLVWERKLSYSLLLPWPFYAWWGRVPSKNTASTR